MQKLKRGCDGICRMVAVKTRPDDTTEVWMQYTQKGQLCGTNLLLAGIYAIEWKVGHCCFPAWYAQSIEAVSQGRCGKENADRMVGK